MTPTELLEMVWNKHKHEDDEFPMSIGVWRADKILVKELGREPALKRKILI